MEPEALARFLEAVGTALHDLAADLRAKAGAARPPDAPAPEAPQIASAGLRLGLRERQVASFFARLGPDRELTASDVAKGIGGYDQANIYFPLGTLVRKALLEEVPGAKPRRWRATGRLQAA